MTIKTSRVGTDVPCVDIAAAKRTLIEHRLTNAEFIRLAFKYVADTGRLPFELPTDYKGGAWSWKFGRSLTRTVGRTFFD